MKGDNLDRAIVRLNPEEVFPALGESVEGYYKRMQQTQDDIGRALGDSMKAQGFGHGSDEPLTRKIANEVLSDRDSARPDFVGSLYEELLKMREGLEDAAKSPPVEEIIQERMRNFEAVRAEDKKLPSSFVLDAAKDIVYGARQHMYGHASVNFARTAQMWEPIFGAPINNLQVGLAMILLKVARGGNLVQREATGGAKATFDEIEDTLKDIAGYAEATMRSLFESADGKRHV